MIIKNSGETFRQVLLENINNFDEWVILDTGSTDNTIQIIKEVLVNKPGKLYQEPFINFRDSRNRCLDLAENLCDYIIMLDDSYIIKGDLKKILSEYTNQDCFSLYIKNNVETYVSTRIIRCNKNIRYIYKVHEIIPNESILLPIDKVYIQDIQTDHLITRSLERKKEDLKYLLEMINEEPDNPRHLYYTAQTYLTLGEFDNAFEYFQKRINIKTGFSQEIHESYLQMSILAETKLNKSWEECELMYSNCIPDGLFFIALHYYEIDIYKAHEYIKKAFKELCDKEHQYKKELLYDYYIPKLLILTSSFTKDPIIEQAEKYIKE